MYVASRTKYHLWGRYAFWIFVASIVLSLLLFVPQFALEHGGARRWLDVGFTTFQPSEVLKFGVVVYLAAWLSFFYRRVRNPYFGMASLFVLAALTSLLLLSQRDTGTLMITMMAVMAVYVAASGRWAHVGVMVIAGILLVGMLAFARPYIRERILVVMDPARDIQGSGYQLNQSLIAIGSGEWTGRGYGQSIQKFRHLPEAHGDSIFAVAGEELGFLGSSVLVLLFVAFGLRGLHIAARAPDRFGGLLATGIVILILAQAFVNMAAMLGLIPLTGVPLPFVSHGGSALLVVMTEVGILMNISRATRPQTS
jgi:cell division protein FtsW